MADKKSYRIAVMGLEQLSFWYEVPVLLVAEA